MPNSACARRRRSTAAARRRSWLPATRSPPSRRWRTRWPGHSESSRIHELTTRLRQASAVYFVGLDLAWGERKPTGVAVVDDDGRLVHVGVAQDDASIRAAIAPYVAGRLPRRLRCAAGGEQPDGSASQRGRPQPGLREVRGGRASRPTPASPSSPARRGAARLADGPRPRHRPGFDAPRRAIEVYPHPATVALFRLGRTLKYKSKPGRSFAQLRSELLRLMDLIEIARAGHPAAAGHRSRRLERAAPVRGDGRAQERVAPGRGSGRRRRLRLRRAVRDPQARRRHDLRRRRDRRHHHADAAARSAAGATGADARRGARRHRAVRRTAPGAARRHRPLPGAGHHPARRRGHQLSRA